MEIVNEYGADALRYIDDNLPHLSGIPDLLFAIFSGQAILIYAGRMGVCVTGLKR